jgi:hypothetical protein
MSFVTDDTLPEEPTGEVVHWMDPGRPRLGAIEVSPQMMAAFALGVGATLAVWAALAWLAPRREGLPPWRWRRGVVH